MPLAQHSTVHSHRHRPDSNRSIAPLLSPVSCRQGKGYHIIRALQARASAPFFRLYRLRELGDQGVELVAFPWLQHSEHAVDQGDPQRLCRL